MGTKWEFACDDCGYTATIAAGFDRGFYVRTETRVCRNCRILVDVAVGITDDTPDYIRDDMNLTEDDMERCRSCERHLTESWRPGDGCPRCDGEMRRDDEKVMMWD